MNVRRPLIAALFLLASLCAQESKTLDLDASQGKKTYFVIFAVRDDTPTGHAFVLWGVEDSSSQRSTIKGYGLYPENESDDFKSVFTKVPGAIVNESLCFSMARITEELIVRVDQAGFERSLQIAAEWKCRREFALLSHDCVEFLRAVGESLAIEMPTRNLMRFTPRAYVRAVLATVSTGTLDLPGATYEGSLLNNQPFGRGVLTFDNGSSIQAIFRGLDHHTGAGRLLLESGYYYEGAVVDYYADGRGTLADPTESSALTGVFEQGVLKKVIHGRRSRFKDAGIVALQPPPDNGPDR